MRMKNDLMAEAKLHDVDPCEGSGRGWMKGGGGVAAGLKRCGGIHPIAIIYLSHVECVSTSTQRPPNHHHHRRATPPCLSSSLFRSILRDHPLGRDLWHCCRSVVINIYYVTCMHRFQLRSCFLPSQTQTRLRLRLHLRLLFQLQLLRVRLRFRLRAGSAGVWYFNMLHEYESSKG